MKLKESWALRCASAYLETEETSERQKERGRRERGGGEGGRAEEGERRACESLRVRLQRRERSTWKDEGG